MISSASYSVGRSVILAGMLLAFTMAWAAAASRPAEAAPPEATASAGHEIIDMRGRTVSVPSEIRGIVALGANSLRLLTYFDAVEKVVAVEDTGHAREKTVHEFFYLATYRIARPELRDLPSIGSSDNHEAIIAAAPDLVFSSSVDVSALDHLQRTLGIPVFAIDADVELDDTERFFEQLRRVGRVLGEDARAEALVDGVSAVLEDLAARAERVREARTAYAGGMMFYGPADLLRTTGDYLPFDLTGTRNVMPPNPTGNRQPYATSIEELVRADPAYVFVDAANDALSKAGYHRYQQLLDEHVTAFRNRDVYVTLVYKYYGTNWSNQLINVYVVGSVLYPEAFGDVVIEDVAEQVWELFFGVPIDYDTVVGLHGPGVGRADWW